MQTNINITMDRINIRKLVPFVNITSIFKNKIENLWFILMVLSRFLLLKLLDFHHLLF